MNRYLILCPGVVPFIVHADDKRAAAICASETLGYSARTPSPHPIRAVRVA